MRKMKISWLIPVLALTLLAAGVSPSFADDIQQVEIEAGQTHTFEFEPNYKVVISVYSPSGEQAHFGLYMEWRTQSGETYSRNENNLYVEGGAIENRSIYNAVRCSVTVHEGKVTAKAFRLDP